MFEKVGKLAGLEWSEGEGKWWVLGDQVLQAGEAQTLHYGTLFK